MTEIPYAPGPPCSQCGEYESVMSLQNMATWETTRLCMNCGPGFLRAIADMMDGPDESGPDPEPSDEPVPAATTGAGTGGQDDGEELIAEPGAEREDRPWPAVTKVVKSTHGHRTPRAATGEAGGNNA